VPTGQVHANSRSQLPTIKEGDVIHLVIDKSEDLTRPTLTIHKGSKVVGKAAVNLIDCGLPPDESVKIPRTMVVVYGASPTSRC
jgi:hypothetical protein